MSFRSVCILCAAFLIGPGSVPAQDRQRQEEQVDYYLKWLQEDVRYIITPEEREVFLSLTTPEEKERFIEQFWFRRDPDPTTAINEFKEEHYRRIAYANDHFDEGKAGWLTDRGRIYILHGPPDEVESHEAGEVSYDRLPHEGGGTTTTFPFIRWWYRHIEGVGDNVELEFVDKRFSGAYTLTLDPFEKDALMHTNYAPTWAEQAGVAARVERFRHNPHRGPNLLNYRAQDNPFEKYRRLVQVQAPKPIKYRDLEKLVEVQIGYELLPLRVRLDYLRLDPQYLLVPITVEIENKDLQFQPEGGGLRRPHGGLWKTEWVGQPRGRRVRGRFDELLPAGVVGEGTKGAFLLSKNRHPGSQVPLQAGSHRQGRQKRQGRGGTAGRRRPPL